MYLPQHFAMPHDEALALIERENFAMLVTTDEAGAPFATHLPFLLDRTRGAQGALIGHLSRANPQWRQFQPGREVLVIFRGPHSYVSPTWYEKKPAVPTWNYAAVHAYGVPVILDDPQAARDVVARLSAHHEAGRNPAWSIDDDDPKFIEGMVKGIVAFEIPVSRLIAKAKMSQNRSNEDRKGVIAALKAADPATAAMMKTD